MYAAIRDGVLLHAGYASIREGLADLGLRSVELDISRDMTVEAIDPSAGSDRLDLGTDEGIAALKSQCESASVGVCAFLMANDFGARDLDFEVKWAVHTARAAYALGVKAVRIDAIMHGERDLPLEQRQTIFFGAMARILEDTADWNTEFGIENHGFQGNDPEFLEGVFDRAGDSRLGLTMDTGNFYWSGKPLDRVYEILEHFAPRAKHTHVKNIRYPADKRNVQRELGWEYGTYVSPIPDGDIDHAKVAGYLNAAGYTGDLTIEDESLGNYSEGADRLGVIRRDAEYVRGIV
jgi:sugar phosphate isomerase/epimerase